MPCIIINSDSAVQIVINYKQQVEHLLTRPGSSWQINAIHCLVKRTKKIA